MKTSIQKSVVSIQGTRTTNFMQLQVWQKAHEAVLATYRITYTLPQEERFGLTSQMRRAAVSIPANIAEGYGRRKPLDKIRFYNIAQASLQELRYYFILARDLGYTENIDQLMFLLEEVARMLARLTQSIERSPVC